MKKSLTIGLGTVAAILLAVTLIYAVKYRQQSAAYAETRRSEEDVRSRFDAALVSIAEIQDSLNAIAPKEAQLAQMSRSAEMKANVSQTQKDQMLNTITNLRESIRGSNQRIRDLEANLKNSEGKIGGLERVIRNLKESVAQKELAIQTLNTRVDSLNTTVAGLNTQVAGLQTDVQQGQQTIADQMQVIEDKRKELGAVYYIVGTKKELVAKGLVKQSGGVLGIGKTPHLTGDFQQADFVALDTDLDTEIPIAGTEPRVLSAQTATSYELQAGPGGGKLLIREAREFRKLKYVVIMVKEKTEQNG